ncbi:MAG: hypothetical protein IPJ77_20650 [Planctomycetes bacterium]|nr:hypothetical protein [Planctomycetota bacterium]
MRPLAFPAFLARRPLPAFLALLALLAPLAPLARAAAPQADVSTAPRAQVADAPRPAALETAPTANVAARDRELASWRELLELDLVAELLRVAAPRVEPGAPRAEDGEALALVARALHSTGAENAARRLLEREPKDPAGREAVLCARARLALERDELDAALHLLLPKGAEALRAEDAAPERLLLAGRALVRSGRGREAERFLRAFVARAPRDVEAPSALHMLAQTAIEARDLARASALRDEAQKSAEWQAFYRTRRLQARERPGEPLPRLGLAELWLAAGEFARARGELGELTALHPGFARGFGALARCERARGDLAAAKRAAQRALELDAALLEAHLELARVLLAEGDRGAAERAHARYVELGGKEPLERAR